MAGLNWAHEMRVGEETNFLASLGRLGSTILLTDKYVEAYAMMEPLTRATADPPRHVLAISYLFLSARYQLQKAMLECLRAHLTDAVQITRRAIESAVFAARIARHPEFAELWLNSVRGDVEHEEFIKKFRGKALFPEEDRVLRELGRRYDYSSKMFHASLLSIANRTRNSLEGNDYSMYFNIYEVKNDDVTEPAQTLLGILDTHLLILGVFGKALAKQLGSLFGRWEACLHDLGSATEAEIAKWREIVSSQDKENLGDTNETP